MSTYCSDEFMDAYFELIKDENVVAILEQIFSFLPVDFRQTPFACDTEHTSEFDIESNVPFKIIATDTAGGFYCMLDDETNRIAMVFHGNYAGIIASDFLEFMHLLVHYHDWFSILHIPKKNSIQQAAAEIMASCDEISSGIAFPDNPYTYQSLRELLIQRLDLRRENYDIMRLFEHAASEHNQQVKFYQTRNYITNEAIRYELEPFVVRLPSGV